MGNNFILISGPPGIGKSTLANGLAQALPAFHLDKDCIDEPFSPQERGIVYTQTIEPKVIRAMLNLAQLNLSHGHRVLLDAPWTHILINSPHWKEEILKLGSPLILECILAEPLLKARLIRRGLLRDWGKLTEEGWEAFKKSDCLGMRNPLPYRTLDMGMSPEDCLQGALDIIKGVYKDKESSRE